MGLPLCITWMETRTSTRCDGLEDHALPLCLADIVFDHLEPSHMVVGLRQQADAALEIDSAHSLEPTPDADPLRRRLGRNLVCEKEPCNIGHAFTIDVTMVTCQ